jgi:hypothetical protein
MCENEQSRSKDGELFCSLQHMLLFHWSTLLAKAYRHHPTCNISPSHGVRRFSDQEKKMRKRKKKKKILNSTLAPACVQIPFN